MLETILRAIFAAILGMVLIFAAFSLLFSWIQQEAQYTPPFDGMGIGM